MLDPNQINEDDIDKLFIDEQGAKYYLRKGIKQVPRKTFIKGKLFGKYRGELNVDETNQHTSEKFFKIEIYEAEVNDCLTQQDVPFQMDNSTRIPREILPNELPIQLIKDTNKFALNLIDPIIANDEFIRKLHQIEDDYIFGTIKSDISGYILDFIDVPFYYKEYIREVVNSEKPSINEVKDEIHKTQVKTGKKDTKENYTKYEYYYDDYKTTYWGNWEYEGKTALPSGGCLDSLFSSLGLILGIVFLAFILPHIAILLPFIIIPFLISLIPDKIWTWILRLIGGAMLLAFIISIISALNNISTINPPKRVPVTDVKEKKDSIFNCKDSVIKHYRKWNDYDGNTYEGEYTIPCIVYESAKKFKNNLTVNTGSANEYNKMLYLLKENDKNYLDSLYKLFDTIKHNNNLNELKFAEMIVSFVQDIPYAIILPNNCNPDLYNDAYIKEYLGSSDAICYPNQKFGINSPVEFAANLMGDCDTRSLLLYTILSHYNYDVAVMSSDVYKHSIIGINLPYNGQKFNFNSQQYTLWETTSMDFRPGIIPNDISNMNYWQISLKSK